MRGGVLVEFRAVGSVEEAVKQHLRGTQHADHGEEGEESCRAVEERFERNGKAAVHGERDWRGEERDGMAAKGWQPAECTDDRKDGDGSDDEVSGVARQALQSSLEDLRCVTETSTNHELTPGGTLCNCWAHGSDTRATIRFRVSRMHTQSLEADGTFGLRRRSPWCVVPKLARVGLFGCGLTRWSMPGSV